jgi:hypothetical protein
MAQHTVAVCHWAAVPTEPTGNQAVSTADGCCVSGHSNFQLELTACTCAEPGFLLLLPPLLSADARCEPRLAAGAALHGLRAAVIGAAAAAAAVLVCVHTHNRVDLCNALQSKTTWSIWLCTQNANPFNLPSTTPDMTGLIK